MKIKKSQLRQLITEEVTKKLQLQEVKQKIIDNLTLNAITGRVYPLNSMDYHGIINLMW